VWWRSAIAHCVWSALNTEGAQTRHLGQRPNVVFINCMLYVSLGSPPKLVRNPSLSLSLSSPWLDAPACTSLPNLNTMAMYDWVIDDIAKFSRYFSREFYNANVLMPVSQSCVERPMSRLERTQGNHQSNHQSNHHHLKDSFTLAICCFFSRQMRLGSKVAAKFQTFSPPEKMW